MSVGPVVLPGLFWLGGLLRLPSSRRSATQRALCGALFCFAAALTLDIGTVYLRVDRTVAVPNLANLGEHVLGIIGVALLLNVLRAIADPTKSKTAARRTNLIASAAVVASAVLFATAPLRVEAVNFTAKYGGVPEIAAYWAVTVAYFGICLVELARLSIGYSRRAPRRALRVGLRFIGAGVTLGAAYSIAKIIELAADLVTRNSPVAADASVVGHSLLAVGGTAMGVGLLTPGAATTLARTIRRAGTVITVCRLRPVWLSVTGAVPHVVLGTPPSLLSDVFAAKPELRLLSRMVEIRDAMLALRPYVTDQQVRAAHEAASSGEVSGAARAAREAASWLAIALHAKGTGARPQAVDFSVSAENSEPEDERAFAKALAVAWAAAAKTSGRASGGRTEDEARRRAVR